MTGNERHDQYEELNRHLDDLMAERHPRGTEPDTPDDLDLLKMAARLRGARPDIEPMRPDFRAELEQRLARELHPAAEVAPSPARRRFLLGGLVGAAASFLAGVAIDRAAGTRTENAAPALPTIPAPPERELVETNGRWFSVANTQDIPPGGGQRFRKGAIEGFVFNRDGEFEAHSAVCTHMGCILTYRSDQSDLFCPCHGGQFHPDGQVKRGRTLKPLPPLRVKVENGEVFVWCMEEMPPSSPA